MEPRCKVCQLRIADPRFYKKLFSEERSLRELQKMARDNGYDISYSSFRRHVIGGERHNGSQEI